MIRRIDEHRWLSWLMVESWWPPPTLMQQHWPLAVSSGMIENSGSKLPNPAFAGESLAGIPMEQAIVIGSIARRVLDGVRFGRVAEIFERSLYLDVNGDWICLADMALGSGPLIVSIEGKYGRGWMHRFSSWQIGGTHSRQHHHRRLPNHLNSRRKLLATTTATHLVKNFLGARA